jgi:hypothetical protein
MLAAGVRAHPADDVLRDGRDGVARDDALAVERHEGRAAANALL